MPKKLLNKNFFLLWQGQFISNMGTQIAVIALVFWIKHTTGSATLMGTIQMAVSLPVILLGPIAGTFADRHSRKKIIVLSDLFSGLAVIALAGFMFYLPQETGAILICLTGVFIFTGLLNALFNPAITAAIPDIVPQESVSRANSMAQSAFQLSMFFGQALGGTIFRILGAPIVFLIDGITFLLSAFSEMFITIPQTIRTKTNNGWREQFAEFKSDTLEGFGYIWQRKGLRELVFISAFLVFFTMPVIVLLPFYVEDFLQLKADWYGYIIATYGIGSLFGYLGAGVANINGKARSRWMIAFILLESAGYGLLGLTRNPFAALLLAFLGGGAGGFVTINITTILQISTPSEIRGRVFGLLATISGALAPLSMGLAGIVADLINQNIPLLYMTCGGIMTVLSLVVLLNRNVRTFLAFEAHGPAADDHGFELPTVDTMPLYQKGLGRKPDANYLEALSACEKALEMDCGNDIVWSRKGDVLSQMDRFSEALADYEKALELNPSSERTWFKKGVVLNRLGRQEEAVAAYERVLQVNPQNDDACYNKGVVLNHLGRLPEALEAYESALEINPQDDQTWYNKGILLYRLGRMTEALAAYERAIQINPLDDEAWYNKGIVLYELDGREEALEAFEHMLKINPANADAWNNKGVILSELGRHQEALSAYTKALEITPNDSEVLFNRAETLNRVGDVDQTLENFVKSVDAEK